MTLGCHQDSVRVRHTWAGFAGVSGGRDCREALVTALAGIRDECLWRGLRWSVPGSEAGGALGSRLCEAKGSRRRWAVGQLSPSLSDGPWELELGFLQSSPN